jgi:flagellar biosynthesis protein FlgN
MPSASPLTTLRDEHSLLGVLLELMKQEQQCLVSADTVGLTALTPQKAQLIGQLDQLSRQRHQALGAAGFAASEAGMQDWAGNCGDAAASALWHELLSATRIAKELNRVNGMLITRQMAHNETVINAMRTPANSGDTGFYGPTGKTTSHTPSRGFVAG